jgi:Domain of unknown function (DUF4397)
MGDALRSFCPRPHHPQSGNRLRFRREFRAAVRRAICYALDLESLGEATTSEERGANVITKRVTRWSKLALLAAGALVLAAMTIGPSYAANNTEVYIVQGLPGKNLDVTIDGDSVATGVKTAAVAGPFKVKPGKRTVEFSENGSVVLKNTFTIKEGSRADIVAHLPASSSGDPLVTVYKYDAVKVPNGKALLVVSHVAAVPPADIRVNDQVLFANIANGESLQLMVPVATYKVSIVPTGETKPVFFGPVNLTVKGGAINRVYAVGDPEKKTMNVAVHVLAAGSTGSGKPSEVNTGTGGQAVGKGPSLQVNLAR